MRVLVGDIRIYIEKKGVGEPLVLVHGNGEDHQIFDRLVERLSHHYTCYLVDSRNHGKSDWTDVFDYDVMAHDILCLMTKLNIKKPYFLGFSDGGIIGLKIAIQKQDALKKMVICGANLEPAGLKVSALRAMEETYQKTKNPLIKMMLDQPHILTKDLANITIPTRVIAGEHDVIKRSHTSTIAHHLLYASLMILAKKNHDDYLVHRDDLYETLCDFFK
ncbi:MAG TPA: alpha/beta hydrolase [Acholeplasmataceae bacterium]|nr:alpha/beta hydrolase [Acholeplasmataceae bacterium]